MKTIDNAAVAAAFKSYSPPIRKKLLALRTLILKTAAETEGVGQIEEALRWGEPSYLTTKPKSGTTIRISSVRGSDNRYALYVNCQTTLLASYRQMYPDLFTYEGDRAIVFNVGDDPPIGPLTHCIAMALRYHADKRA